MSNKKPKGYRLLLVCGIILFAVGTAITALPHISAHYSKKSTDEKLRLHEQNISEMYDDTDTSEMQREIDERNAENPDKPYTAADYVEDHGIEPKEDKFDWALIELLREQMEQYNSELIKHGQYELSDPFLYETPSFLLSSYGIPDDIFGHIFAPSIDMDLPIYLGASEYNMNFGAVHLTYSSMPIGGADTNAVFAGHRGVFGRIYFDNIVYLEEGDDVYVSNPWETLHYKVISSEVISPYDIEKCYIREGEDLITLLTCHPYGYTTYRYMVVCGRVELD